MNELIKRVLIINTGAASRCDCRVAELHMAIRYESCEGHRRATRVEPKVEVAHVALHFVFVHRAARHMRLSVVCSTASGQLGFDAWVKHLRRRRRKLTPSRDSLNCIRWLSGTVLLQCRSSLIKWKAVYKRHCHSQARWREKKMVFSKDSYKSSFYKNSSILRNIASFAFIPMCCYISWFRV